MEGIGSAVFLKDFVGHNFYRHLFLHHTSLCVALDGVNCVWTVDTKPKIGTLLGWGSGGALRQPSSRQVPAPDSFNQGAGRS